MNDQQNRRARTECALLRAGPVETVETAVNPNGNRLTRSDRAAISRYFEARWRRSQVTQSTAQTLRRRWIVGGRLPANVPTSALPSELTAELTPLDAGYDRLLVRTDVICVELDTLKIIDVMRDAGSQPARDTAQLLLDYPANQPLPVGGGHL